MLVIVTCDRQQTRCDPSLPVLARGSSRVCTEPSTIYDVGEQDGKAFIAMEFLEACYEAPFTKARVVVGIETVRSAGIVLLE